MEDAFRGAWAIVPIAATIGIAIGTRRVTVALLTGIWVGATLLYGLNPVKGFLHGVSDFVVVKGLAEPTNAGIVVFCLLVGGMLSIVTRAGGTAALSRSLLGGEGGARSTQVIAGALGIAMFFDDYVSTTVVGNTMAPMVDRYKVSRDKLAYIADATSASVASVAPVSTWTAMQLGLIATNWPNSRSPEIFARSLPFHFYTVFSIALVFVVACLGRDFGPMLRAEVTRAQVRDGAGMSESTAPTPKVDVVGIVMIVAPLLIFIALTIVGLWSTGHDSGLSVRESIGRGDPARALVWAVMLGTLGAIFMGMATGRLRSSESFAAWLEGLKLMVEPAAILVLSFSLKSIIGEMGLAAWVVEHVHDLLSGPHLPSIVFLLSSVIAFATGTSWGTNAILMPLVVPIALGMPGVSENTVIVCIAAVFTGAVFGDHCSPISDTTVLAAVASGTNTADHFRTQLPYGILGWVISVLCGFVPVSMGLNVWASLLMGVVALVGAMAFLGRTPSRCSGDCGINKSLRFRIRDWLHESAERAEHEFHTVRHVDR